MGALKALAISTFNRAGLDLYGSRMASSWAANGCATMRIYREGWSGAFYKIGVEEVELLDASRWLGAFRERNRHRTFIDYRWDAVRFSHKVAAMCHAAREPDLDLLIWIDGDVITHSPLSKEHLHDLAPKGDEWVAWLDREKMYPETGIVMLNCRHPQHEHLIRSLEELYITDMIYGLEQFHDSWALEQIVVSRGIDAKSLSGKGGYRTTHPMINGPLGAWFDHAKGDRKRHGGSSRRDLIAPRTEPYWQGRR